MDNPFILLVEDNPDDEALTLRSLRKNNIMNEVAVVRDGVEALDFLFGRGSYADRDLTSMPRLVLLDLKLPKIDGLEVLRQLRQDPRTRHLTVVIFTSSNEEQDIRESQALGANSYICKPVDFTLFNDVVRKIGTYWLQLNKASSNGGNCL